MYNNQDLDLATDLLNVVEEIRYEMDANKITKLSLLDHSNAFDSIDHTILCNKLKKFSTSTVDLINSD